jgi:signal transduction histidine kinase
MNPTERELHERIKKLEKIRQKLIERSLRAAGQENQGYGLLESNVRLAEQVRIRTQELEEAKNEAEDSVRLRTAFLTTMSHEIRTPLNGILGMTTLLLGTKLDPEQTDFADTIRTCGNTLLDLINDILDFSRLDIGNIEPEQLTFDPRELIKETILIMHERVASKSLELVTEIGKNVPLLVVSDPARIKQVLINLIANAVKFTESGTITVRLEAEGDHLCWSVEDTGIGIASDAQEKLFQPFVQEDASTSRRFGGTGLGLAICKQIVELLSGTICVKSFPGRGSCFTFRFPVQTARLEDAPLPAKETTGTTACLHGKRALVVEDNTVNQRVAVAMLRSLGVVADVAAGGEEALDAVGTIDYDVVFMDCQMPGMDGYETTRRIRKDGRQLPIIALTANAMPGDAERCRKAGMDDHVAKPVTREMLKSKLLYWTAQPV